jgi:hypothetical protein
MEKSRINAECLSGRQLSVALTVAGLSPAAALAGRASWPWLVFWCGVGVAMAWLTLRRLGNRPVFQGKPGIILSILYKVGAVLLAARVLGRASERLEITSGGSPGFWLTLIIAAPLLWMCWGKAAPFFRMAEVLWLAMAAALALILIFGLARVEWQYVSVPSEDWAGSLWAACEILSPALFLLPYIYNVEERSDGRGIVWLSVLSGISAALCLVTGGILGRAAEQLPHAFYVAAGLLGKSSRCEGLLSVLWLLPDLTLVGLACRVWGSKGWPVIGMVLAIGLAFTGTAGELSEKVFGIGMIVLWGLILFLPGGKGKIVVRF